MGKFWENVCVSAKLASQRNLSRAMYLFPGKCLANRFLGKASCRSIEKFTVRAGRGNHIDSGPE